MSAREIAEWRAFDRHEPIGPARLEVSLSILAALLANANRGRNRAAYLPHQFVPGFWRRFETAVPSAAPADQAALQDKIKSAFARFRKAV